MKVVIIGGGAGGASCAARLRRLDDLADIVVLEKSGENSVATCGLPYYIGGVIAERKQLQVASPILFKKLYNIDVRLNTEVAAIQPKQKTVLTTDGEAFVYDKLVIATGTATYVPPFEGLDNMPYFVLKTLEDADKIKEFTAKNKIMKAAVVGGGFVGVEIAENLKNIGVDVAIIEKEKQILKPLDEDMVGQVQQCLRDNGVGLYLGASIKEIGKKNVVLNSGDKIAAQMLIFALGNYPQTQIAAQCGIETTPRGLIKVNEYMQTNVNNIYACGDVAALNDAQTDEWRVVALGGPANKQGRLIADHIAGIAYPHKISKGCGVIKVFAKTAAFVGYTEQTLREAGISYEKMIVWGNVQAGYYNRESVAALKVMYDKNGRILGAQTVGEGAVEKYIDVISALMQTGGTVEDLRDFEHCYAPPYDSAKSLLNVMGMAIENVRRKYVEPCFGTDFGDMFVLDVRPEKMFAQNHIDGAVNIPSGQVRERINEIPEDKTIMVYCVKGHDSYVVARMLLQNGFNRVLSYAGGWRQYETQKGM